MFRNSVALVTHYRIIVVKVGRGNPAIESTGTGVDGAATAHRTEMPFAKMTRGITQWFERLGDRDLLRPKRVTPLETPESIGMSPGQHTAARRRTNRRGGVKTIHPQTRRRHGVQIRRLENRMTRVTDIAPTLIVSHAQNNIGKVDRLRPGCAGKSHEQDDPRDDPLAWQRPDGGGLTGPLTARVNFVISHHVSSIDRD